MSNIRRGLLAATIAVVISAVATACLEVNGTGKTGASASAAATPTVRSDDATNNLACKVMKESGIEDLVPASVKARSAISASGPMSYGSLGGTVCAYGNSRSGFVTVAVYRDQNWDLLQNFDLDKLAAKTGHGEGFYGTGESARTTFTYNGALAWQIHPIVQPTTGSTCTGTIFRNGKYYAVDLEFASPQQCAAVMNVADQASSYLVHLKSGN